MPIIGDVWLKRQTLAKVFGFRLQEPEILTAATPGDYGYDDRHRDQVNPFEPFRFIIHRRLDAICSYRAINSPRPGERHRPGCSGKGAALDRCQNPVIARTLPRLCRMASIPQAYNGHRLPESAMPRWFTRHICFFSLVLAATLAAQAKEPKA